MGKERDFYTLQEAAEILGVSSERIEHMLIHGELEGYRQAGRWRIPLHAVDRPMQLGPAGSAHAASESGPKNGF
jgi:excisionase family DNA binding protein